MADKDKSKAETAEEMEQGLELPSGGCYKEVNEIFKMILEQESEKETQLTETQIAEDRDDCNVSSCAKTMPIFTEQAALLMDVADISNSLTSQSHDDKSPVKQTGENDNKLLEKPLQISNLDIFQQIKDIFEDQLCLFQSCLSDYKQTFYEILDLSRASQTAENVKEKLAFISEKQEQVSDMNKRLKSAMSISKEEVEKFKTAKRLEATNQVQACKFEKSEWQVECGKLVKTHKSKAQKIIDKVLSIHKDLETALLESRLIMNEMEPDRRSK